MKRFKLLNNIFGWIAFAVAATTYLLTMEPTASFWDCGEFISSAYRLEVGHPPGAPFFMLTARIFTLFASDPSNVAMMVNAMSALCSAFTILFLFWTITHLARKLIVQGDEVMTVGKTIAILGSGMVGALAYTFSDTFWFSAVEAEVYAYSSFFTSVVFWLILKWEDTEGTVRDDRWFVLIAYLMGLSIGVHLLNLLVIPAIVLVYYFKKYTISVKGVIFALLSSFGILALVLYGLIPGFIKIASWLELLCVNKLGLSYNSGLLVYVVITFAVMAWATYETAVNKNRIRTLVSFLLTIFLSGILFLGDTIYLGLILLIALSVFLFTYKNIKARLLNTIVLCIMVMLVGYSSYSLVVVRSLANPPMDQNSPEDVFSLQYYLNREQYGDRPLVYGPVYSAPEKLIVKDNYCVPVEKLGSNTWVKKEKKSELEKDEYICTGRKHKGYETDSRFNILFPRMYKGPVVNNDHINAYKEWGKVQGKEIVVDRCGREEKIVKPTFTENLRFFFSYQLNFMYWRYFMWNFSGRQNDIQGHGEIDHGNWITGFDFIDNQMIGNQSNLPSELKNNKGHNVYYMLPLLLGILGILYQLGRKEKCNKSFWLTFFLFFMTGIAIVIYLNQTPYQPRERDYAYAGSFYAFCIWIGLGVLAIIELLEKLIKNKAISSSIATVVCLFVPALMAAENWDDHDRSNRTACRDFGSNYLMSCPKNAIIFTNGDNDTFPLWYNQEVEGNRTDIRVCNLSYLQGSWYIDQMKRQAYESEPLPISWDHSQYRTGMLDMARTYDHPQVKKLELKQALDFVRNEKYIGEDGIGNIPVRQLYLPIDSVKVVRTGTVAEEFADDIVSEMTIPLKGGLSKADLMVLEMLQTNEWKRPIYFAVTVGEQFYPDVNKYFQLEGLAYRLVPIEAENQPRVNTEVMFDNMMNKFRWGGVSNPKVYIDETLLRLCRTHRLMFAYLSDALIKEGKNEKALQALDRCMEVFPIEKILIDYSCILLAKNYYQINEIAKGDALMRKIANNSIEKIEWILSLSDNMKKAVSRENGIQQNLAILQNVYSECDSYNKDLAKEIYDKFETLYYKLAD
ncbi:MAG: DUF2723 domain-containing protein [Paludibacteraceae bacterium]|nr:DUF2723 domain-containing protein [Paludibacteraceae bacterium]